MLFLAKKILPQLFISIILEDEKNTLKASVYRTNKLIKSHEKSFDKSENLLEYVKNLSKGFLFYHIALFLNVKEQGLIASNQAFNTEKSTLEHILLNNALIYTAKKHIKYYSELFKAYKALDFLYSPFALLYYKIQTQKQNDDEILLYGFKQGYLLAIIVAKGDSILYGAFKVFKQRLDLKFSQEDEKLSEDYDEFDLKSFEQRLDLKFSQEDEKFGEEESALKSLNANDHPELLDQEKNLQSLDNVKLDALNQLDNDMELCRYIITSIENFYNDDKNLGVFINKILLYSDLDINSTAIEFLENETFLEIKTEQINVFDLMIELMQKELK